MKPVCVPCERFYRPHKNGFSFIEGMPNSNRAPSGKGNEDHWRPYKLWEGDIWRCDGCGAQIIVGTGWEPVSEHHKPGFKDAVVERNATLLVKDC